MSNSPVLGSQFSPISWTGDACEQFASMFQANERMALFLNWLLNESGAISDGALDSFSDRITPVGVSLDYTGDVMPSDYWLPCTGQELNRTTYAKLFAVIGTRYGEGDGSDTFNLPDSRDRASVGSGSAYVIGEKFGADSVTLELPNLPKHYHGVAKAVEAHSANNDAVFGVRAWSDSLSGFTAGFLIKGDGVDPATAAAVFSGDISTTLAIPNLESPVTTTPHDNRQKSLAFNKIIKVK